MAATKGSQVAAYRAALRAYASAIIAGEYSRETEMRTEILTGYPMSFVQIFDVADTLVQREDTAVEFWKNKQEKGDE